ncbi:hypothetical protein RHS01_11139 [Rhizoctonia solani]|uniref:CCHC-type domain-containing protein n=1 Tax=Rhizoctonia solani TaxID=456999 RepID=A0A8H7I262_9AGAM|nr:hypothetical protein RHS01_11139 [Rhizoctonia solani]
MRGLYHKVQNPGNGTGLEQRGPEASLPVASTGRTRHLSSTTLSAKSALATHQGTISLASHPPTRGTSTGQQATKPGRLSSDPNFVSKEERNCRRAEGLCIKCGKLGHKFAECRTGWKAMPKEEGIKKEAAKVGEESGPELGKD